MTFVNYLFKMVLPGISNVAIIVIISLFWHPIFSDQNSAFDVICISIYDLFLIIFGLLNYTHDRYQLGIIVQTCINIVDLYMAAIVKYYIIRVINYTCV